MKKTIKREIEVNICDACHREHTWNSLNCLKCGKSYCWECHEKMLVEYSHAVYFSGSGDGKYCKDCDSKLKATGTDPLHQAYLTIKYLRDDLNAYTKAFEARKDEAEKRLAALQSQ